MNVALRLLIADDSPMFRKLVGRYILEHSGVDVVGEAVSGTEALRLAGELKPDVVILDVNMPDLSCESVCTTLRKELPGTRIYLCSAHPDRTLQGIVSLVKANGILRKDSLKADLLVMIRDELGKE